MVRPGTGGLAGSPFDQAITCRREITAPLEMNDPRLFWSKMTDDPLRCQTVFVMASIIMSPQVSEFQPKGF